MPDERLDRYARMLVEYCLDVQHGWQVLVTAAPAAEPLVQRVAAWIAGRGAYAVLQIQLLSATRTWAQEAPETLVGTMAPVERSLMEQIDAHIRIQAPAEESDLPKLDLTRRHLLNRAARPAMRRHLDLTLPWVGCHFPTPALARQAGLSLEAYTDVLYAAALRNWEQERVTMARIKERFDRAQEVRIVGPGTDLKFSLRGRHGMVDDSRRNVPGGEVFYCPVEDSAEGEIYFGEVPAVHGGQAVEGLRLVLHRGEVREASAEVGEAYLRQMLAADEGARRIGEFGIGCNTGLTVGMRNTLFDEKINGTVHLALGNGFPFLGGTNYSSIHWDLIKDLRCGGSIFCDGELVQEDGGWLRE
jgi:aminopeptidase